MLEFLEKVWDCISVGEVTSLVSIPSTIKKKKGSIACQILVLSTLWKGLI